MDQVASDRVLLALEYDKIVAQVAENAKSKQGNKEILNMRPLNDKVAIEMLLDMTDAAYSFLHFKGFNPLNMFYDITESLK